MMGKPNDETRGVTPQDVAQRLRNRPLAVFEDGGLWVSIPDGEGAPQSPLRCPLTSTHCGLSCPAMTATNDGILACVAVKDMARVQDSVLPMMLGTLVDCGMLESADFFFDADDEAAASPSAPESDDDGE